MKLHRDIGHDRQMTPIDFQVTRSKVKVTVTTTTTTTTTVVHSDKKRIHTMAATTTDSPYGGHACFTNSPVLVSLSL